MSRNVEQVIFGVPSANTNGNPTPGTSGQVARADHNHGTMSNQVAPFVVTGTVTASSSGNGTALVLVPDSGFSQFVHVTAISLGRTGASSSASSTITITATFTDGTTASASNMQYQPAASSTLTGIGLAIGAASSWSTAAAAGWSGALNSFLTSGKPITQFSCVASSSVAGNPFGTTVTITGTEA